MMAQVLRSAKSANDWTDAELTAYNISVTPTSPADFFVTGADPSLDHLNLNPALTTNADDLLYSTGRFFASLDFAIRLRDKQDLVANQNSAIVNFSTATLSLLDFDRGQTKGIICFSHIIPFKICGEDRESEADVCLVHLPDTILMVLAKDLNETTGNAEAQAIAQAIAAYQSNNTSRAAKGKSVLETMTIPCIAMHRTIPSFYLVPVTRELSDAVGGGQYPTTQTRVLKCATVPGNQRQARDGMADRELRMVALMRFLAFKSLAMSHWQHFID